MNSGESKKPMNAYERWAQAPTEETFKSIAESTDATSHEFLFRAYAAGIEGKTENDFSVKKDPKLALEHLEKAADGGSVLGKINFGRHLIPQARADPNSKVAKRAEKNLLEAEQDAKAGRDAKLLLGILYEATGRDVLAQKKLEEAVQQKSPDAAISLTLLKIKKMESRLLNTLDELRSVKQNFRESIALLVQTLKPAPTQPAPKQPAPKQPAATSPETKA